MKRSYYANTIVPLLQKLGNFRTPYLIFVDETVRHCYAYNSINELGLTKVLYEPGTFTFDALQSLSANVNVVVVIDSIDNLIANGWQVLFHEFMLNKSAANLDVVKSLQLAYSYDAKQDADVYVRKIVKINDIRTYSPNGVTIDGFKFEQWHTLGRVLNTPYIIVYIWDIREIVYVGKVDIDFSKLKQINDNSRMLYISKDLYIDDLKSIAIEQIDEE